MRTDVSEVMGRKLVLENPIPRMVLEDALHPQVFFNANKKGKRECRRYAVSIMSHFESKCTDLCNSFFRAANENMQDEKLKSLMISLDDLWKDWLKKNISKYHYENCKDYFATRIAYLIAERKKATENILQTISKPEAENKV